MLQLADSAFSLDMDSMLTTLIEDGRAAQEPSAAAVQQGGQAPAGSVCRCELLHKLSRRAQIQYRCRVLMWVEHLEHIQAAQKPTGTRLVRMERTLAQLRRILEEIEASSSAPVPAGARPPASRRAVYEINASSSVLAS